MVATWLQVIQQLENKRGMSNDEHAALARAHLARDVAQYRTLSFIIGIEVVARDDWPCPRAKSLAGFYLLDEVPDVRPPDCQGEYGCACTFWLSVMDRDVRPEAVELRRRLAQIS